MEILKEESKLEAAKKSQLLRWVHGETAPTASESLLMSNRFKMAMANARYTIQELFTRDYWRRKFQHREEDVLVDANILSWAYLECGILQSIGCLITFFFVFYWEAGWDPAEVRSRAQKASAVNLSQEQRDAFFIVGDRNVLKIAQSSYFLAILIQQCFNHFICKVSVRLPFGRMLFKNTMTWYGIAGGIVFSMFIVYVPYVSSPFITDYVVEFNTCLIRLMLTRFIGYFRWRWVL
jgi:sodium/potassium-transporting ATPase subunit alpha